MAHRATGPLTFLVEHYRPGGTPEVLQSHEGRVRSAVRELQRQGHPLRLRSSIIVPGDEALLCVLEGASERLVRETYARADVSVERISPALSDARLDPEHHIELGSNSSRERNDHDST